MSETREPEAFTAGYSLLPLLAVIGTSLLCITVSIVSLMAGWFIIFQNLYYLPIIIACVFFRRQGFLFSALLAGVYLVLFATFTRDPSLLQQALIRVALFILIAGVITVLSLAKERTERALKESENKYRTLIANIPEVTYRCAPGDGTTMSFISDAVLPLTGYPASDFTGNAKRSYDSVIHPDDREKRAAAIQAGVSAKERYVAEYRLLHADGRTVSVQEQGQGVIDLHGTLISLDGIILDVTDRKQAEEIERLHATRVRALLALHQMTGVPEKVLLEYVMNTSLAITASRYSFIGLMSEDESAMTIHAWSPDAMADWTLIEKPIHFPIAGAGIWGECVRNRAPVIINDYSSPHPAKHGCPEGHVPITRYLGIPIFEGLRIAAVLAVANKEEPYSDEDADLLLVLGNQMWEILHRKRVMEELRLKDSAIESSINAIALADTSGILTHVNPAFLRIGEYEKPADVLGRPAASFIREPAQAGEVIDALQEHGSWSGEVEAVKKDGSPVIVQVLANRILDADGTTVALMASLVDITDRKQAEIELRTTKNYLESLIDYANAPIIVWNPDFRITRFNHAFEELTGIPVDEAVGSSLEVLFPEESRENSMDMIRAAKEGERWDVVEIPILNRSGQVRTVLWNSANITDHDGGALLATIAQGQDITDRKQAEDALRESQNRLAAVIAAIPDLIFVMSRDGEYREVYAADEERLGMPVSELIGKTIQEIGFSPATVDSIQKALVRAIDSRDVVEISYELAVPLGLLVFEARLVALNNHEVLGIVRDITEWRAMEQEQEFHTQELARYSNSLAEANRKLNLLSSITRHDILNQVLVLLGYLSLSRDSMTDPEQLLDCIEKQEQAAKNIQHQINFTREYQDMGVKAPVWHSLQEVADSARRALPSRDIRVSVDLQGIEVYADPLFERVFYNLIENALKYGGEGMTRIRMHAEESREGLCIICEDDGRGISAVDKKHLFDRGYGKGTGLGLFLSREILAITGITITETGEPGKGARFEIHVPPGQCRRME